MNVFHCSITKAATLMFNMLFGKYKFKTFEHRHFSSIKDNKIPDNTIITHVTNIKYSDFFNVLKLNTVDIKGFYVARDPREVIISAYYSWMYSHPGGHNQRELIKNMRKDDALIHIIDDFDKRFDVLYDWVVNCNDERFKVIKFEDFFINEVDYRQNMKDLFKFLELTEDFEYMDKIIDKNTFKYLARRKQGNINNKHHYRAGINDTWKDELSNKVLDYLYDKKGKKFFIDIGYQI